MSGSPTPSTSSSSVANTPHGAAVARATKSIRDFGLPSLRTADEAREALWSFSAIVMEGWEGVPEEGVIRDEWARQANVSPLRYSACHPSFPPNISLT